MGYGWNWISAGSDQIRSLWNKDNRNGLFGDAHPGDIIKDQRGFARFYENFGWFGSLTKIRPGNGYRYKSFGIEEVVQLIFHLGRSKVFIVIIQ